jgi:hypothetical protein
VCRRRRAEIAVVYDRLPLSMDGAGDDGSVGAETSVDGTAGSVDHSDSGVVAADSTANSWAASDHSDGTSTTSETCSTRRANNLRSGYFCEQHSTRWSLVYYEQLRLVIELWRRQVRELRARDNSMADLGRLSIDRSR